MDKYLKEKFLAYEGVKEEGKVNMFDVNSVAELIMDEYDIDISTDDIKDIQENYDEYKEEIKQRQRRIFW